MDLEKLSAILTKYQYKNKLGNQKVYVKLGFSQSVEVVPKENEKVLIANKLEFWNPLTGAIEMSLKKAMTPTQRQFFSHASWLSLLVPIVLKPLMYWFYHAFCCGY